MASMFIHSVADDVGIVDTMCGRNVFITGGSGFLGKMLVEKLLRSCPGIGKIYLLVRPKRGAEPSSRLEKLFNSEVFDLVRQADPQFIDKIGLVCGDITMQDMGINSSDRATLCENVDVIFHLAATIRFDEPLGYAIALNICGVRKLIDLAKSMRKLSALVHVSTAYANCDKQHVSETVYSTSFNPDWLIEASEWMTQEAFDAITPMIIAGRPNTYTFTKALAEYLLERETAGLLPIAIFRPSIVCNTWREPIVGWVDNFNGPSGIYASMGKGLLRSMMGNTDAIADLIPVDVCVNMLIAVAWRTIHTGCVKPIPIYHCTTGHLREPCTWGIVEEVSTNLFRNTIALEDAVMCPKTGFTTSRLINITRRTLEQTIPAYLVDMYLRLTGKRPFFVKLQKKVTKATSILEFFTLHQWSFSTKNTEHLLSLMHENDRKKFYCDVSLLNWAQFLTDCCIGTKKYLLKEDMSRTKECLEHINFLWKVEIAVVAALPLMGSMTTLYRYPGFRQFLLTLLWRLIRLAVLLPITPFRAAMKAVRYTS